MGFLLPSFYFDKYGMTTGTVLSLFRGHAAFPFYQSLSFETS